MLLVGLAGGAVPYLALAVTCDTAYYIPLYTLSAAFDAFCTVAVRASHDPPRLRPPFVPLLHPLPPAPCLRVRSSSRVRPQLYSLVADQLGRMLTRVISPHATYHTHRTRQRPALLHPVRPPCPASQALWCTGHKRPGDVNVQRPRCRVPGCEKHSSYGAPGTKTRHRCATHSSAGDARIRAHQRAPGAPTDGVGAPETRSGRRDDGVRARRRHRAEEAGSGPAPQLPRLDLD